jgi:hypothetical protein
MQNSKLKRNGRGSAARAAAHSRHRDCAGTRSRDDRFRRYQVFGAIRRYSELFGGIRSYSEVFGAIRRFSEAQSCRRWFSSVTLYAGANAGRVPCQSMGENENENEDDGGMS